MPNDGEIQRLIETARSGKFVARLGAVAKLGEIGTEDAEDGLLAALADSKTLVRQTAARALVQLDPNRPAEPLLTRLREAGVDAPEPSELDADDVIRLGLIGLRSIGTLEALTSALRDPGRAHRFQFADALGYTRDERAVSPLLEALNDDDALVRAKAAEALGRLGNRNAVQPLAEALYDGDRAVRKSAAEALARLGDDGRAELERARCEGQWSVRRAAAKALRRRG